MKRDGDVTRDDVIAWLRSLEESLLDELRARGWTDEAIEKAVGKGEA